MDLRELFNDIGLDLKKEIIRQLSTKKWPSGKSGVLTNKIATGKLVKSIDYSVVVRESQRLVRELEIKLFAEPYLEDVDKGRKPGQRPIVKASELDRWIVARRLAPRDSKGRLLSRKSIKFLVARSINQRGIRPTNIIQISLDAVFQRRKGDLERAAVESFQEFVNKIIK